MKVERSLRVVALFEAAKGVIVLLAGFGLLTHLHGDAQHFGERVVSHLHLNPARGIGHIFIAASSNLGDAQLLGLAAGAMAYSLMRLAEAYGLWNAKAWAEWFAVATGLIYIPFELHGFLTKGDRAHLIALVLNIAVVALMAIVIARRRVSA